VLALALFVFAELPALADQIASGTFDIDAQPMPLAAVERAWADAADHRIVLVAGP
jgi:hypothetical protein